MEAQGVKLANEDKIQKLVDRLGKVRRTRDGFKALCPAHVERTPSLHVKIEDDKILLHCFGQKCKPETIVSSIGLEMSDLFLEEGTKMTAVAIAKEKGKKYKSIEEIKNNYKTLEEAYEYKWLNDTIPSHLQVRFINNEGTKDFHTYHKSEDGFWYAGKGDGLTPLYNLDGIKDSKAVLIVEGEKVVELLKKYGIPATTSLGGSNAAETADWTPLMHKPSVVMWRDFDDAGLKYQESVNNILKNLNIPLRKVEVEKFLTEKGDDLEEYVEKLYQTKAEWTAQEMQGKIYSCFPKSESNPPSGHLKKYLTKVYNNEIENIEIPGFPILTDVAQMFTPGSISLIYSGPGIGKSLLTQQFADDWTLTGRTKVKRLLLESSINMYLLRCLSRMSNRMDVLKMKFHRENPEESKKIVNEYIEVLDICGSTMTTSDSQFGKKVTDWNEHTVIEWIKNNIKDNNVLIIDPISRILNDEVWRTTNRITAEVESLVSQHPHASILFIHHPDAENNVSGGRGWSRFCHNILEIVKTEEEEMYEVLTNDGDVTNIALDRYIRIRKCRSGEGMDYKIGIGMSKESLHFQEKGRILRKIKT